MSPKAARKKAPPRAVPQSTLADIQGGAALPLVAVPAGGTLRVIVDVGAMNIPYAVAYAGHTVIKSLVDRSEQVQPLQAGDRVLGWSFAHAVKGWHHTIAVSVNDGPPQILERRSETNKDADHSVGFAVVRTGVAG